MFKFTSWFLYNLYFLFFFKKFFFFFLRRHIQVSKNHISLAKVLEFQTKKLRELIAFSKTNIEYYKINYEQVDVEALSVFDLSSLKQLPVLTKDIINQNELQFHNPKMRFKKRVKTSGSTGKSLGFYRSEGAFINSQISFFQFLKQFGVSRFDKNIYIGGARRQTKGVSKIFKIFLNRLFFNQIKIQGADLVSDKDFQKVIQLIESFKPKYLWGFSNNLFCLAEYIKKNNIRINHNINLIHPTAEILFPSQRKMIQEVFQPNYIRMVYGATESNIATECQEGLMHLNYSSCVLTTDVDDAVLLTVFDSNNFPLINYKMGDKLTLEYPDQPCKCGQHTPIIKEILGREQDRVCFENGMILTHPDVNMFIEQIDNKQHLREYQFIYYQDQDLLEMRVSAEADFDDDVFKSIFKTRFNIDNFFLVSKPFEYRPNGKKPLFMTVGSKPPVREHFEAYEPYQEISASQLNQNLNGSILKLDWNEATEDFPKAVKDLFLDEVASTNLNFYPDLHCSQLRKILGENYSIPMQNILVFNGSDSSIDALSRLYLESQDTVSIVSPNYGNYAGITQRYGANIIPFHLQAPFTFTLEEISQHINLNKPKMLFLSNPNNPTGALAAKETIEILVKSFPETIFIIDEAYIEFGGSSIISEVLEMNNAFVLRTFSKAYGLAGVRLGYVVASEANINLLKLSRDNKEVSVISQIAGKIAIKNKYYMTAYVEKVNKEKEKLKKYFDALNVPYFGEAGNFILFKVGKPKALVEMLGNEHIYIRDRSNLEGLSGFVRVTVGTDEKMQKFRDSFSHYLNSQ